MVSDSVKSRVRLFESTSGSVSEESSLATKAIGSFRSSPVKQRVASLNSNRLHDIDSSASPVLGIPVIRENKRSEQHDRTPANTLANSLTSETRRDPPILTKQIGLRSNSPGDRLMKTNYDSENVSFAQSPSIPASTGVHRPDPYISANNNTERNVNMVTKSPVLKSISLADGKVIDYKLYATTNAKSSTGDDIRTNGTTNSKNQETRSADSFTSYIKSDQRKDSIGTLELASIRKTFSPQIDSKKIQTFSSAVARASSIRTEVDGRQSEQTKAGASIPINERRNRYNTPSPVRSYAISSNIEKTQSVNDKQTKAQDAPTFHNAEFTAKNGNRQKGTTTRTSENNDHSTLHQMQIGSDFRQSSPFKRREESINPTDDKSHLKHGASNLPNKDNSMPVSNRSRTAKAQDAEFVSHRQDRKVIHVKTTDSNSRSVRPNESSEKRSTLSVSDSLSSKHRPTEARNDKESLDTGAAKQSLSGSQMLPGSRLTSSLNNQVKENAQANPEIHGMSNVEAKVTTRSNSNHIVSRVENANRLETGVVKQTLSESQTLQGSRTTRSFKNHVNENVQANPQASAKSNVEAKGITRSDSNHIVSRVENESKIQNVPIRSETKASSSNSIRAKSPAIGRGAPDFNDYLSKNIDFKENTVSGQKKVNTKQNIAAISSIDESKNESNTNLPIIGKEKKPDMVRIDRLRNSPLQYLTTEKNHRKTISSKVEPTVREDRPHNSSSDQSNLIANSPGAHFQYGSAQRLSSRLTRAERFNAPQKDNEAPDKHHNDNHFIGTERNNLEIKKVHPVFGYSSKKGYDSHDESISSKSDNSRHDVSNSLKCNADPLAPSSIARRRAQLPISTQQAKNIFCPEPDTYNVNEPTQHLRNSATNENPKIIRPVSNLLHDEEKQRNYLPSQKNALNMISNPNSQQNAVEESLMSRPRLQSASAVVDDFEDKVKRVPNTSILQDVKPTQIKHSTATLDKVTRGPSVNWNKNSHGTESKELISDPSKQPKDANDYQPVANKTTGNNSTREMLPLGARDARVNLLNSRLEASQRKENMLFRGKEDIQESSSDTLSNSALTHQTHSQETTDVSDGMSSEFLNPITEDRDSRTFKGNSSNEGGAGSNTSPLHPTLDWREAYAETTKQLVTTYSIQKPKTVDQILEDDDDIFSGLDEDSSQATAASNKSEQQEIAAIRLAQLHKNTMPPNFLEIQECINNAIANNSIVNKSIVNKSTASTDCANIAVKEQSSSCITTDEKDSTIVEGFSSSTSVSSDVTSSVVIGSYRKGSRFRPRPEDTIVEESGDDDRLTGDFQSSLEERDDDEASGDDSVAQGDIDNIVLSHADSAQDEKPTSSVFLMYGCSLVDSLQTTFRNACHVSGAKRSTSPVPMAGVVSAAVKTNKRPESVDGEDTVVETIFMEDETKLSFGQLFTGQTASSINETERRVWDDWESRDKEQSFPDEQFHRPTLSVEISQDEKQLEIRRLAQKQLLQHIQKAITLHGNVNINTQNSDTSTDSSESEKIRPKETDLVYTSPVNTASTTLNNSHKMPTEDKQDAIAKFISSLKHEGVEVLKLGRRNNWQIRFLTVSREVSWSSNTQSRIHCPQCPQALLWLKQFNSETYSIDAIKGKGRGGVLFSQLLDVELQSTEEQYKKPFPKRFQQVFPTSAGVVVSYIFEGGTRRLLLCFKNVTDAQSFCTSMKIIKNIVDRWMESEISKILPDQTGAQIAPGPTES